MLLIARKEERKSFSCLLKNYLNSNTTKYIIIKLVFWRDIYQTHKEEDVLAPGQEKPSIGFPPGE